MSRYLKALGLAFLVVLAIGAIAAAAAQAEGVRSLTPASYPAWLTAEAEGNQVFKTNTGVEVVCTGMSAHATIPKAGVGDTLLTFTDVRYSGCETKIGASTLPTTFDATGCDYVLNGGQTDTEDSTHYINGTPELPCPAGVTGPDMTIFSNAANHTAGTALCHMTFWNSVQSGSLVTYTNVSGTPDFVTVKGSMVVPTTSSGSVLCGAPSQTTYMGAFILRAYKDEGTQADGTTPKEGGQIGLTVSHL